MNRSSQTRAVARALGWILTATLVATPCAPAFAQKKPPPAAKDDKKDEKREKARESFKRGQEKFDAGDYAGALEGYRGANDLLPSAQAQYRIALSLDKMGKTAEAVDAYKAFLAAPPPEAMGEQKAAAERRVSELAKSSIKITSTPAGASIKIDGERSLEVTPTTLSVKPGPHTIELSAPDRTPVTKDVTVASGATVEVSVELTQSTGAPPVVVTPPPSPPPPPPAPVAAEPRSKLPAYITLGLAGGGVVVGTIFGIKALGAKSDFKSEKTSDNADRAEKNALIADMAFGVALTLGITGTVLLLSSGESKADDAPKAARLRLAPILTPQTQGLSARFQF